MDAQWLNDQFEKQPGKTRGSLSEMLGIQPSGVSKMLAGTRQIKAREYMLMRKFFGQSGMGDALDKKSGTPSYGAREMRDFAGTEWTGKPLPKKYDLIEIRDAAAIPDFFIGERVLIDTTAPVQENAAIFALEENGQAKIRLLQKISPDRIKIYWFRDEPGRTVAADKIKILGRLLAKLEWL